MNKVQLPLVISYLAISCYFFSNWLKFSLRHPNYSPQDKFLSFVMFLITTILWPLLVPISCVEIYKTRKLEFSNVIPFVVAISALSVALYMG